VFIEQIINKLSREKSYKLAENLSIEEDRLDILKKRLLHALSSEAFLAKIVDDNINEFKELLVDMFEKRGIGKYPEKYKDLIQELEKKGLIYFINKEHTKILLPFEFYFVSDFFSPSYFSLLYAFQNYDNRILSLIADYLKIEDSLMSKLTLARKIYYYTTNYLEKIKSSLELEEIDIIKSTYYKTRRSFWDKTFRNFINNSEKKEKFYIKELFLNSQKDNPLYSLLIKTILVPVSDRTRLFVEELTVPSEFENNMYKKYREKENKIICDLQDYYEEKDEEEIHEEQIEKDFKTDLKKMMIYIAGSRIKATTTEKIYCKDMKRILDNFGWQEHYFNLMWKFQKSNKLFTVDPEKRIFKISEKGREFLNLDNEKVLNKMFDFFINYSCCSLQIKNIILKELLNKYPCLIDLKYFLSISKRVASELSRLMIKEDLRLKKTFHKIYYLLYNLGFAKRVVYNKGNYNIHLITLNSDGYKLVKGEKFEESKPPKWYKNIDVNDGRLIVDLDIDYDIIDLLFNIAKFEGTKDKIFFRLNSDKIQNYIKRNKKRKERVYDFLKKIDLDMHDSSQSINEKQINI